MHEVGHDSRYARVCKFLDADHSHLTPCFFIFFILGEAGKLLPHMLQFTDEHREEGKAFQRELVAFQEELSGAIEEVWTRPPESGSKDAPVTNVFQNAIGVGVSPGTSEIAKPQDPLDKIAKPQITEPAQWRVTLWDKRRSP